MASVDGTMAPLAKLAASVNSHRAARAMSSASDPAEGNACSHLLRELGCHLCEFCQLRCRQIAFTRIP
ncbi:hypothetical protein ACRU13_09355 [Mycobacterium colombiense]